MGKRLLYVMVFGLLLSMMGHLVPQHATAKADGELTYAMHVTIPPAWFDPGENTGIISPKMVQYGLHDSLFKPMPEGRMTPSLAESFTESADKLTYEFTLRPNLTFHNGDPVTAEDVKFTFERYKGAAAKLLKERVKAVDVVDARRVRFQLHTPWSDFLMFYATPASGASWIMPKKYYEKVGDEGYKQHPVGAGPYKFMSQKPGVELVLEAHETYWRKTPHIKRLIMRVVPDDSTRLAMLKRGEADIAYLMVGAIGDEVKRIPELTLIPSGGQGTQWLCMFDQGEAKSPWHDQRVRLAANYAIDRKAISDAESYGAAPPVGSIIPKEFEYALTVEPYAYNPEKAKQLLKEAGYPNGFDAGDLTTTAQYSNPAEAAANYLAAVGIRSKVRTLERAAWLAAWKEKSSVAWRFVVPEGLGML
ncbi:MAG: ABC transporter substrate-binding protein [Candidatus Tectomicrobia bacterium]|uniref:ABC transporter substrate-binding protein n=1 Tax=Tectimicrobiota bacterium TaxID=2528274 RepID=A0A937W1T6_UNCTE|nr:ABC transporter substrate-binding protein [Candidatus Tectomicrobia bacterium]